MSQDVELGLKFTKETSTSVDSITSRMQRLDKEVMSVQSNLEKMERTLNKIPSSQRNMENESYGAQKQQLDNEYKNLQKILSQARTEKQALERSLQTQAKAFLGPNATRGQRDQISSAIRNILANLTSSLVNIEDSIREDARKRNQKLDADLRREEARRKREVKKRDDDYYASIRAKESRHLSSLLHSPSREKDLLKSETGELRALKKQVTRIVNQAEKQGSYTISEDYRKFGNEIGKTIADRMNPASGQRRKILSGLTDSDTLTDFIRWAKPTELTQFKEEARKKSRNYSKDLDVDNAEKMAKVANKLDQALKQLDPKVNRLYTTANQLHADPAAIKKLQNKSIEDLGSLQQAMLREAKKNFNSGDAKTGQILADTSNQIKSIIQDQSKPYIKQNQEQLRSLLYGNQSLDGFTGAGLKSLKSDALAESTRLSKIDRNDPIAEDLRKLSKTIQAQIDQRERLDNPSQPKVTSPTSELSDFENTQVRKAAMKRFDDSMFSAGGSLSNLKSASAVDQQDALKIAKRLEKAQQLRYTRALENNESEKSVRLEKEALRLASERLNKVKATVQETKRLRDAEERRKSIDVGDLQYSAQKDLVKSNLRRQVDGGAEQFRNQGLLLRNYALMGAGIGGAYAVGQFTVDLDRSLKQLQSILALTNTEMLELEGNLIKVSEKTKFTAVEVTEAGIILGQSGLSKDQIIDTVEGITLFATAIGTDLKTAVDLATSTLGVFNIDSSRMTEVVDKLTISVNSSKLNLDKLTLGIQYAGNIAAQSNVSFEETVATLGAMANSGIKSGSTLGTGLRQILITLQNPSDKFRSKIQSLGLTMEDLNLRTHGLVKVMTTLANRGFTVTDAMQVMEVRAASAFGAFSNNLSVAEELSLRMEEGGAATKANTVQMEAFSNQLARFGSIAKSVFYDALKPFLSFLTTSLEKGGDFLQMLRDTGGVLSFILGTLVSIGALRVGSSVLKLLGRLTTGGLGSLLGSGAGGAVGATGGRALLGTAARFLVGGPVVGGLAAAGTAGVMAYQHFNDERKYSDPLDIAAAAVNKNEATLERYDSWLKTIGSSLSTLYLKQEDFKSGDGGAESLTKFIRKLNNELKDMGFYLDENAASFSDVSEKLLELKTGITNFRTQGITEGGNLVADQLAAQAFKLLPRLEEQQNLYRARDNLGWVLDQNPKANIRSSGKGPALVLAEQLFPELANLNPADITRTLTNIKPEAGAFAKAQGAQSNAQEYFNYLSAVGNLPDSKIAEAIESGRGSFRYGNTSEEVQNFRTQIQLLADTFKPILNSAQEITRDAKQFEDAQSGVPQAEIEAINLLNSKYGTKILTMVSELGVDKSQILSDTKNDPLLRYEKAVELQTKTVDTLIKEVENAAKDEAKALLKDLLGDDYDDSVLTRVLNKSQVTPDSMNLRSQLSAFISENQGEAEKSYYQRSEAELNKLNSEKGLVTAKLQSATTDAQLKDLQIQLMDIEDEIAKIQQKRNLFRVSSGDTTGQDEIEKQGEFAKIARDAKIAEQTAQRSARLEVKEDLENQRSLRLTARYHREQGQAIKDYYNNLLKEQKIQITESKTKETNAGTNAETIRARAAILLDQANDSALGEDTRIAKHLSVGRNQALATQTENQGIGQLIRQYQDVNKTLQNELVKLREQLKDPKAVGDVATAINSTITKYNDEIADNKLAVEKLTGEQKKNSETLVKSQKTVDTNTRALERQGYRFRTVENERMGARLRGETFTSDTGATEDFSNNQGSYENYANVVLSEGGKAYADFDALTASADGLIDIVGGLGDAGASAFSQWISGASDAETAFKSFGIGILQQLGDMAAKIAANQLMTMLIGSFAGSAATGAGASSGSTAGSLQGTALFSGGLVTRGYSSGGEITSGMESRDSTLIKAAKGEFVLRNEAVKAIGVDTVRQLNSLDRSSAKSVSTQLGTLSPEASKEASQNDGDVNFWVVLDRKEMPQLGRSDVLMIIEDDVSRGGKTKQLIKSVSKGDI